MPNKVNSSAAVIAAALLLVTASIGAWTYATRTTKVSPVAELMEQCLTVEKPKAKGEDALNYVHRLCWLRAKNGFPSKEK